MSREKLYEIGAIALALFMAWAAFHMIDAPPMTRGELADWAQGIGSIAAVGIAAWVGTVPVRQEARRVLAARRQLASTVLESAEYLESRFTLIERTINARRSEEARLWADNLEMWEPEAVLLHLLQEPAANWPALKLYVRAHDLVVSLRMFKAHLTQAAADTPEHWTAEHWGLLDKSLTALAGSFLRVKEVAKLHL